MRKQDLIETGFELVFVPKEESGDQADYFYYKYEINSDIMLLSNSSDEINNNNWKVYEHSWGIAINDIDDVLTLINLFNKWKKIPL